jgi:hypothetical protein
MQAALVNKLQDPGTRGTLMGGFIAGMGRLVAEYVVHIALIVLTLILIWYYNPDMLRAVPVLKYFIPDGEKLENSEIDKQNGGDDKKGGDDKSKKDKKKEKKKDKK